MKNTNRKFEYQRNSEDEWVEVPTGSPINYERIFLAVFIAICGLFILSVGIRIIFNF